MERSFESPTAEQISALRLACRLDVAEASELVKVAVRTWQGWEAGSRSMPPGLWDLFRLRTGKLKLVVVTVVEGAKVAR